MKAFFAVALLFAVAGCEDKPSRGETGNGVNVNAVDECPRADGTPCR